MSRRDAFYFCCTLLTTVGYGDIAPQTVPGKAFTMVYILLGLTQERSQLKNKELAFSMLRAKLFALQEEERLAAIASTRKMQVGTGSRSEKIRTYNYKDSRCTDHRLGSNFALDGVLTGQIEPIIQQCIALDEQERLKELGLDQ